MIITQMSKGDFMETTRAAKEKLATPVAAETSERTSPSQEFSRWSKKILKSNAGERIRLIRAGVDAMLLVKASEYYEMPRAKLARIIGLSSATADRKIKAGDKLGSAESERLTRIALIEAEAEQVFGSAELAKQWMLSNNLVLGESPLSLLDTDAGSAEVRRILSAIAHGGAV